MKKILIVFFVILYDGAMLYPQIINKEPLSSRQTSYNIDVKLDPSAKKLNGDISCYWINNSTDLVPDIQLHLYMNAFRNNKSTFYKEHGGTAAYKESDYGWIDILTLSDRAGRNLIPHMQYISPDDDNSDDRTVVKIDLPEPARPGDTVFLNITFESKLPAKIIRTGYTDDYFFVAQWFPKFGVYEPAGMRYALAGAWNCHQFHSDSEFYSNHSVYDVRITLPEEYVVGTGGVLLEEKDTGDGNKTLTYRAEDIVDFAWTAWPGYAVFTDQWRNVKLRLLVPDDRINLVERQFRAVKNALEYFNEKIGPYPWPYLTFVDPPSIGSGASGMEYTTLFTSSSFSGVPDYLNLPEITTIHEFGHAYFMGVLASNEFEEPWLDEGVNSFWEARIMDHYYGIDSGETVIPLLKVSDISLARISYITSPSRQIISNIEYSWNYPRNTYGMMSYYKPAIVLYTLMGIIGEETIDEIFSEYYRQWAFRYPSGKDFINVVNEVVQRIHGDKFGSDMNWFFDQTIFGTGICDYKVSGVFNVKLNMSRYNFESDDKDNLAGNDNDSIYKAIVQLERAGEVMLPVEVLIHFSNGDEVFESWDGKSRIKDFTYTGNRKVEWVKIDPEYKIKMDVNFINNSLTLTPDRLPLRILTNKLISFMQFFLSFISL